MKDNFLIEETSISGVKILKPQRFSDDRGHLTVSYNKNILFDLLGVKFVQDKWTKSDKGVLRGIHFQRKRPQGKLISVLNGKVLDVIVDLRRSSSTFGQYISLILKEDEPKILYIPKGLGHAFLSLKNNSIFFYKTTDYFFPEYDHGIKWNDNELKINWQFDEFGIKSPIVSNRDKNLSTFKEYRSREN